MSIKTYTKCMKTYLRKLCVGHD